MRVESPFSTGAVKNLREMTGDDDAVAYLQYSMYAIARVVQSRGEKSHEDLRNKHNKDKTELLKL